MKNFSGKVAVITGAGAGIGQALAVQLAERGSSLALADVNDTGLRATRAMVTAAGTVCSTHVVDVADRAAVEAFAADVFQEHGAVHLVVNNAGVAMINTAEQIAYADLEWIMNINFWGVVYGTKAFLPYLRKADEAHIVNVSSILGLVSAPLSSAYSASKFAVRGFTEALKFELAGSPINVSVVYPGGIKTSITKNSRIGEGGVAKSKQEINAEFDERAITTAEKAAAAIIRGIERNKRRILIGSDAKLADWIGRHFPGTYEKIMGLEKEVRRRAEERAASKP
ncbi:MAG: SDR family NAD(P)-dependent oxidoreductase [Gammaproteobacteria bacterium]|nr:SDR family NAD(P)-dependent oxidoreductase [Gammaproteobacteria bacterium]